MAQLLSKVRSRASLPLKGVKITGIPAQKNLQSLSVSKQEIQIPQHGIAILLSLASGQLFSLSVPGPITLP